MTSKLLAIRIRRRSVAAAIFSGRTLEYLEFLNLCNEAEDAADTTARLLARILENAKPGDVVIGSSSAQQGVRVAALTKMAEKMLGAAGTPIWKVDDKMLLECFAVPKLKNKQQLRPIVQSFWPQLAARQLAAFEAAALGLYFQTERLLSHN